MAGAAALVLSICTTAFAQSWPTKPIRWVVPFPPGGANDITTRTIAERLTQAFGQSLSQARF